MSVQHRSGQTASNGQSLRALVQHVSRVLCDGGIDNAALDARLIVLQASGLSQEDMLRDPDREVSGHDFEAANALALRRVDGEPVARLAGQWSFHGHMFALSSDTLVPRPETEILVDFGIAAMGRVAAPRIADMGTGSGCIVLSLLQALPSATGVGTDVSAGAIGAASENAFALGLDDRVSFHQTSWLDGVEGVFDLIVSNPPYIATDVIAGLQREVRDHDPHLALDGGSDGLAAYRALVPQVVSRLAQGGACALEIGIGQDKAVADLLVSGGLKDVGLIHDLAGIARVVTARRD